MSAETPTEEVTTTEETTTKETTTPKTDVKEPKPEATTETKEATTEETPAEESTPTPIEPVTEESYVSPPKETSPGHKRVLSKHQSAKKEKYGVVFAAKKDIKACSGCSKKFSLMVGKNHCRKCGGVFCSGCTKTKLLIEGSKNKKRICDGCVDAGCRQSTFAETDILHKDEKEEEEEEIAAINEDPTMTEQEKKGNVQNNGKANERHANGAL